MPVISRHRNNGTFKCIKPAKVLVAVLLLVIAMPLHALETTTRYNVLHSGKVIGHLDFYQRYTGDDVYLKMISEVKMKFIFSISVNCNEESVFQRGRLISSHVLRKVNGKEKANRQTRAVNNGYQTWAEGKSGQIIQKDIRNNLMLLYSHEPADNAQVYSDNFQQFLTVKQTGSHVYLINLPDGNYNYYTYTNGICSKVEVHHSLYTIQIQLA